MYKDTKQTNCCVGLWVNSGVEIDAGFLGWYKYFKNVIVAKFYKFPKK